MVEAALARLDAAADDLLGGLAGMAAAGASVGEREWREVLSGVDRVGRRVDAARLRTIAGAAAVGAPERMGFVDTGSWVSKHTGVNRPSAASDAWVAQALGVGPVEDGSGLMLVDGAGAAAGGDAGDVGSAEAGRSGHAGADSGGDAGDGAGHGAGHGDRGGAGAGAGVGGVVPRSPAGVALDAGEISAEHARVIVRALEELPDAVGASDRVRCERELVRLAVNRTPAQLRKAARRVLAVVEAEVAVVDAHEEKVVADGEDAARLRSAFWVKDNRDGTMTGHFTVPWYSGAALKKVIDAMTAPRRSSRLASLATAVSGAPTLPNDGDAAPGEAGLSGTDAPSGSRVTREADDSGETGAPGQAGAAGGSRVLSEADDSAATAADASVGEGERGDWRAEQLTWQQKRGLAFADLLTRIPTDHLHPKSAATVLVTVDLDTLTRQVATVAGTDVGDDVSAGQVRRLACEAGIVPVVLGGTSVPLDLGRQRRFHSEAQRAALALIYDECAADGCDRPLAWTETHHLRAWRDGGHTRIDEAVPLCGTHHHLIDRTDTDHRVERHLDGSVTIHFRKRRAAG